MSAHGSETLFVWCSSDVGTRALGTVALLLRGVPDPVAGGATVDVGAFVDAFVHDVSVQCIKCVNV